MTSKHHGQVSVTLVSTGFEVGLEVIDCKLKISAHISPPEIRINSFIVDAVPTIQDGKVTVEKLSQWADQFATLTVARQLLLMSIRSMEAKLAELNNHEPVEIESTPCTGETPPKVQA